MSIFNLSNLNLNAVSQAQAQRASTHHIHNPTSSPDSIITDISDCSSEEAGSGTSNTPLLTTIQEQLDMQKNDVDELTRVIHDLREKASLTEEATKVLLSTSSKIQTLENTCLSIQKGIGNLQDCLTFLDNRIIILESQVALSNRSTLDKVKAFTYTLFESMKRPFTYLRSLRLSTKVILMTGFIFIFPFSFRYIRR